MRDEDKPSFAELVQAVYAFYGKDVSPFALDVWWSALRRFDLDAVQRAFSLHCQDPDRGQWLPKPADIVRLLDGGSGDRSLVAWSKVEKAIREIGPCQSVIFDDPVIHAVVRDMGGWVGLCEVTDEELPYRAAEFRKRYQGYMLRGPGGYPKQLTGIHEAENVRNGFAAPEPVLVGEHRKCLAVFEGGVAPAARPRLTLPQARALLTGGERKGSKPLGAVKAADGS